LAPTVGIAATGFCHPGGILQLFHREDQQILWLPTAAARSLQQISSCRIIFLSEININDHIHHLQRFAVKNRRVRPKSIRMQHRFVDSSDQDITSKAIR
jgi:hypothetical protein